MFKTIKVYTKASNNPSEVGESYVQDGVTWRNAVSGCNADGTGVVFLDCEDESVAELVKDQLEADDRVESFQ